MVLRVLFIFLFSFAFRLLAPAQILQPVKWSYDVSKKEVKIGEEVELIFNAKIDPDWYLYSSDFDPNLGPTVTTFEFKKNPTFELVGKIKPVNPKKKYDDIWGGEYTYFTKTGQFRQKVKILQKNPVIKGTYDYQTCTEVDGKCIPFNDDFTFDNFTITDAPATPAAGSQPTGSLSPVKTQSPTNLQATADSLEAAAAPPDNATAVLAEPVPDTTQNATQTTAESTAVHPEKKVPEETAASLWQFFLIAFGSGLIALLTPCVFPMVPMTVSFFTGGSGSRAAGIFKAVIYGLSIIAIYTLIGTLVARVFGGDAANFLSTHWLPNVAFFLIFLLFGMSFLGMFEITLPSSWLTSVDKQADKGGWLGVFFMAFTLVLVSFSCTGPIVGSILIASASGETLKPMIGMFAYSLAFALPFTLFAIFPSWLSNLPRSGGWLNSVKVVLGFIELALALKFLSIADQVYHWNLLNRDVYLALWIVIFSLLGFYLLGKIKLPHDSDLKHLSVPRVMLALISFAFVVYLVPGLFGAPLRPLSGYLPPQTSRDFNLTAMNRQEASFLPTQSRNALCEAPKYADFLELPHGLQGYFDLDQALKCAKAENKPIFIDFTGHGCVNCREMEANVWSDPEVLKRLRNDYVVVALYVDDKTELPKEEQYVSKYDGKEKTTIGRKFADYQVTKFNVNAQPYYVLLGPDGEKLNEPIAYNLNVAAFVKFLDEGKAIYQSKFGKDLTQR
ncbi:protein-disulfide reductase DsbD family protein [Adhaeribacter soli]|uniref:Thioredoxin fold domain-containing protein n=1 Tax=Adhaeribacter soli TaxID=2607655 RepID=A0A5N1IMB8_9BACT|nr:thioredoxin family protein [Adhaeribacter soli]KAA9331121.1 thioredoxin fold domain-containing protein [Adhaeribacter soli]